MKAYEPLLRNGSTMPSAIRSSKNTRCDTLHFVSGVSPARDVAKVRRSAKLFRPPIISARGTLPAAYQLEHDSEGHTSLEKPPRRLRAGTHSTGPVSTTVIP